MSFLQPLSVTTGERVMPLAPGASAARAEIDRPPGLLRVLHVLAPGRVGGLESVVLALAAGQLHAGHEVRVACVLPRGDDAGHPFLIALASEGVEAVRLPFGGRDYLKERAAVRDLCRHLPPDIVHTHGYRPDVVDSGVARATGIPTVTTVHGFTGGGWRNRLYERLQIVAFRRMSAVVAVSRPLKDLLTSRGVSAECLHLIPNAYRAQGTPLDRGPARRALAIPEDSAYVLGFVGRLSAEKGADIFLDALARIVDERWHAVIIGDGPGRDDLRERARALGIADRVHWAGLVPDAGSLYSAFDAFVLSSRTEGTPIALFEAMACERPIVATRVGGVPDVVTEADAVLVEPDAASVAAGIRRTITEVDASRARGVSARRMLHARFAPAPWLDQYAELYHSLVAQRTRRT